MSVALFGWYLIGVKFRPGADRNEGLFYKNSSRPKGITDSSFGMLSGSDVFEAGNPAVTGLQLSTPCHAAQMTRSDQHCMKHRDSPRSDLSADSTGTGRNGAAQTEWLAG
jgi:hypothetical protein